MEQANNIDQRLTELEIKASFTEDLLDQLDQVIARQQKLIDVLTGQLAELRQHGSDSVGTAVRNLRDDLPPHY